MDVALRRVKHMRKVYNRDLNVKYILVYVTDGLDNISVQTAKNNLSFPKKRNYKTPDKYKKKMNKRIKRISKYKKDIKNQFDIYPMVFTGSDLGLVEADILLNNLKEVCQNGYNFKNVNKYNLDTSRFDRQCVIGLGAEETSEIVAYQGYPAANWCVSRGNGWYLPSIGELYQLLVVANAENGKNGFISVILTTCGGTPLDGNWYWSSTEENAENIYNISAYGRIATEIKCEKVYVRAVRQF